MSKNFKHIYTVKISSLPSANKWIRLTQNTVFFKRKLDSFSVCYDLRSLYSDLELSPSSSVIEARCLQMNISAFYVIGWSGYDICFSISACFTLHTVADSIEQIDAHSLDNNRTHSLCKNTFQLRVKSNLRLQWFCFAWPCDWSRKLVPFSQPIRCKCEKHFENITK